MTRGILILLVLASLTGCVGIPKNVSPVENLDANRYLGLWHEIARLDHSFERGLERVNAQYSLNQDGSLKVLNRGYDPEAKAWREAEGKAYFVGPPTEGRLKVSFFGPFYGAYNIIDLDDNYGYSLVCGANFDYLWILSRTPALPDDVVKRLVEKARTLGFPTDKLIFVKQ